MTPLLASLVLCAVFRRSLTQVMAPGEPLPEVCTVQAWVRAEDLSPSHVSRGELRIKVLREECANQIASVALRLQLDELGEVKHLKSGAVLPEILPVNQIEPVGPANRIRRKIVYDYQAHDDGLSDPELWTVKAEERRAWMTKVTLLDNNPDLTQPIVTPFTVAVPAVNYPPAVVGHYSLMHVYGPISRYSSSILAYRYIAVVKFTDGRTENVLAGHTTFVPVSEYDAREMVTLRKKFEKSGSTTFDHPGLRKHTEKFERCLPEPQRSAFFAEIFLEDGQVVHKGQALKGRVTVHSLKAGLTTMSYLSVSLRSRQRNHWAKTQARTGGDTDYLNVTSEVWSKSGSHRALDADSVDVAFMFYGRPKTPEAPSTVSNLITSANPSFDFELRIPRDAPADFASYYSTMENYLDFRLTVLYPPEVAKCIVSHRSSHPPEVAERIGMHRSSQTEEESTGDDAKIEAMWDSYTRVGNPDEERGRSMHLQASVTIIVLPHRATATPSQPVAHYLKRGLEALAPVLRSGTGTEMPDTFPVAEPVFTVEALADTFARLMRAGSTDPSQKVRAGSTNPSLLVGKIRTTQQFPDPTKNYFHGNFAGLLWKKKMVAQERVILLSGSVGDQVADGEMRTVNNHFLLQLELMWKCLRVN